MKLDLLRKNELKIENIRLERANLTDIAAAVADVMSLDPGEVFVTDVLENVVTLDILRETLYPHQVIDRKDALLAKLGAVAGVTVTADTIIVSQGMLGWIAADAEEAREAMARAEAMSSDILARLSRRVMIFSTGAEVAAGKIEDTNAPTLNDALTEAGYGVRFGGALNDDLDLIAGRIRRAVSDGYTIIITTGGVGAELKDCTVEATQQLDPTAATPYIVTFERGKGRHAKLGVRIGVGELQDAIIINLPGPNDEVRASIPVVLEALSKRPHKDLIAEALAANLRTILREKMKNWRHQGPG